MTIFHCRLGLVSRRAGRNAVAAAAYQSASRLHDTTTGLIHNYRRKVGVIATGLVGWDGSRAALWSEAERDIRRDARTAKTIILSLPATLDDAARLRLVRSLASSVHRRWGVAVDYAVHRPDSHGSELNHHAHFLSRRGALRRSSDPTDRINTLAQKFAKWTDWRSLHGSERRPLP